MPSTASVSIRTAPLAIIPAIELDRSSSSNGPASVRKSASVW